MCVDTLYKGENDGDDDNNNNNNNNNNIIKRLVYPLFCMGLNFDVSVLREEEIEDVGESEMENEIFYSGGSE
jgi:hypothetical protein